MFSCYSAASKSAVANFTKIALACIGAAVVSTANAGVILFDDFSASRPDVYVRANPIDAGSTATTAGVAGDYWSSRTLRIVSTTGTLNKTQAWIENDKFTVANADDVSSRSGISWSSRSIPSNITGWTLTAELLSLDTGSVFTAGSSVTRQTSSPFVMTLITLGTGTALAAINQEFYIDSGIATDFTLDNVRLNFTCRAIADSSDAGVQAAIGSAGSDQCGTVSLPGSLLLFCLGGFALFGNTCRRALQTLKTTASS